MILQPLTPIFVLPGEVVALLPVAIDPGSNVTLSSSFQINPGSDIPWWQIVILLSPPRPLRAIRSIIVEISATFAHHNVHIGPFASQAVLQPTHDATALAVQGTNPVFYWPGLARYGLFLEIHRARR